MGAYGAAGRVLVRALFRRWSLSGLGVLGVSTGWGGGGGVGVAGVGLPPLFCKDIWQLFLKGYADHQSARAARPPRHGSKREGARAARQSAEARRMHARLHDDAQEAELGAAEGRTGPADQWVRGDGLHPGRRA